jgi:hypothetical protein
MNELLAALAINAELLADTLELLPPRLRRKLDAEPALAASWPVRKEPGQPQVFVDAGDDVVITLKPVDGVVREANAIVCSCLLAPACLHRGAVASLLVIAEVIIEVATAEVTDTSGAAKPNRTDDESSTDESSTPAQRAAALAAWESAAPIVTEGITTSGALRVASLLRAVNLCRSEGMHVLARSALRVAEHIKLRGVNDRAFALSEACDDLRSLLQESWLVRTNHAPQQQLGSGRRQYRETGGMRLVALACEPIVTSSGFAGVVTHLVDPSGNHFHLSEVMPGGAAQVRSKYATAVRVGETTITHEDLSRRGLIISGATAAPDGRLGAGQGVKAAPLTVNADTSHELAQNASGPSALRSKALSALMAEDDALVVARVVIVGAQHNALRCRVLGDEQQDNECEVSIVAPTSHPALPGLSNLQLLSRKVGLEMLVVCCVVSDHQPTLKLLSFCAVNAVDVVFPETWQGRCNVGIDRLEPSMLRTNAQTVESRSLEAPAQYRPSDDARRALERVTAVGMVALRSAQAQDLERTAARLHQQGMTHGSRYFRDLVRLSFLNERNVDGRLRPAPVDQSASAWLACAVWEREFRRRLALAAWNEMSTSVES